MSAPSFVCGHCNASHDRGPIDGRDTYRCLNCGQTSKGPPIDGPADVQDFIHHIGQAIDALSQMRDILRQQPPPRPEAIQCTWCGHLEPAGEDLRDRLKAHTRVCKDHPMRECEAEVAHLTAWVNDLQSGMTVNCVYCGYCYGPKETTPVSMADALKAHIETCEHHPLNDARYRITVLEEAIREHRDQRGDDRCWQDDHKLYAVLKDGWTPPKVDSAVELENCKRYIACRQDPNVEYVSPQRMIERLQLAVTKLLDATTHVSAETASGDSQLREARSIALSLMQR